MFRPRSLPSHFVARGRVRPDRTQRKLVKKATSGLAARALGASLADSETLVNKPAREGHVMVMFHENVPLADPV
jgi:hypothetical protein